jgi:hypothetical protein
MADGEWRCRGGAPGTTAFDLEEYRSRLKKLKYMKPGKIFDLIEKEKSSSED